MKLGINFGQAKDIFSDEQLDGKFHRSTKVFNSWDEYLNSQEHKDIWVQNHLFDLYYDELMANIKA